ncbi:SiaC family regulatory phosphoprotein [Marinoscillum furvescens]|uniref:Uncharacterized protein DUF1987 n=1 Tax=Marinoscillum furvescens DSM 4134 TaxID=1122208 RepID=A0A3D9KXV3_MARFU|nr:SiaC family regulatory phosphoprotein [Marinoscillum furvescens]RED91629.1 uncharacterized protein DUF1987 [Marinoscillum furvescens DSM 4134]
MNIAIQNFNTPHQALLATPVNISMEPTEKTPFVRFSNREFKLQVKGASVAMDMHDFYNPILSEFKKAADYMPQVTVELYFSNLNTSTAKVLFDLFKYLRSLAMGGKKVKVIWGSEAGNTDMLETGMDYQEIYELEFEFVS